MSRIQVQACSESRLEKFSDGMAGEKQTTRVGDQFSVNIKRKPGLVLRERSEVSIPLPAASL